jgi:hypothetical protein
MNTQQQTNANKNSDLAVFENNPQLALPLFATIILAGFLILPFGDLIVEGLWPHKEIVAWIVLGLVVLVVLGREFRRNTEALVAVGVVVHKRFLKHQESAYGCQAIPQEGWEAPQTMYPGEDGRSCYEQHVLYQR